jgi:hypothetical protein
MATTTRMTNSMTMNSTNNASMMDDPMDVDDDDGDIGAIGSSSSAIANNNADNYFATTMINTKSGRRLSI